MKYNIVIYLVTVAIVSGCSKNDDNNGSVEWDKTPYELDIGNFPVPPISEDNTLTEQGVQLGRMLFYDKKLSRDGTQACASCHMQEFAFNDTARFSLGVRGLRGKRQAMSVFNTAWHTNEFFWDGRAHLLRDQALKPIQDELEMDETLENVIEKLKSSQDYKDQFIRAFGSDEVTEERMALALEQFMNSIVSTSSKYDDYLADPSVFTESEERGKQLFFTEYNPFFPEKSGADCAHCHSGYNFENDRYMNNGLDGDAEMTDLGRWEVTEIEKDKGKFKVPSLRNIELTAPYMHDGRFSTLEEVVDHYDHGLKQSSNIDPALVQTIDKGLMLSDQDKKDLIAFMKTLTDQKMMTDERYASPF